jgi:hypothetical protein
VFILFLLSSVGYILDRLLDFPLWAMALHVHAALVFLFISATISPSHHSNIYFPFFGFYIVSTAPAGELFF